MTDAGLDDGETSYCSEPSCWAREMFYSSSPEKSLPDCPDSRMRLATPEISEHPQKIDLQLPQIGQESPRTEHSAFTWHANARAGVFLERINHHSASVSASPRSPPPRARRRRSVTAKDTRLVPSHELGGLAAEEHKEEFDRHLSEVRCTDIRVTRLRRFPPHTLHCTPG